MATVEIVPTTDEHITWMQEHCRAADRAEFWESYYQTPQRAAEVSRIAGETFTALHHGIPVCIFGIIPASLVGPVGHIWLVSSEEVRQCVPSFLRRCKSWLLEKSGDYVMLLNYVDARYVESLRWVEWLGFEIEQAKPYGQNGLPFHRITFRGGKHGRSSSTNSHRRQHDFRRSQSEESGRRAGGSAAAAG